MTIFTASEVRAYARSLPTDQNRAEVRIMAAVITLFFVGGCMQPVFLIMTRAHTPVVTLASLSGAPYLFAFLFLVAAVLTVPHLWALALHPERLGDKRPRKMATAGAALGSLLWLYLANLSVPLDMASWVYFAKAFASALLVGGVYAFSLNSQQVRQNEKPAIG